MRIDKKARAVSKRRTVATAVLGDVSRLPNLPVTKPIPVSAARKIAEDYGYDQVVVMARKVGDNGVEHVTTFGVNKVHCDIAARIGRYLKHKVMGWPNHASHESCVTPGERSDKTIRSD